MILINAEKASDKLLQTFMIKAVSKVRIERNFFNLLRGIYKKSEANILVNNERLSMFSTLKLGSVLLLGFPGGSDGKESESAMQETWVQCLGQKILWRWEWLPTPVFLPGEFHGQRSLVGYSPWDHRVRHD